MNAVNFKEKQFSIRFHLNSKGAEVGLINFFFNQENKYRSNNHARNAQHVPFTTQSLFRLK